MPSTEIPGATGIAKVTEIACADPTQFEKKSKYFDPKSSPDSPRWITVKIEFVSKFPQVISLTKLKSLAAMKDCLLVRPGNRLSIIPLKSEAWKAIINLLPQSRHKL